MTETRHLNLVEPPDDGPPGPPADLAAERAVLGAMLTSRHAIDEALELVAANEFYRPAHELIFTAIAQLHLQGEPADPITVSDHLDTTGDLKRAGGRTALHELVTACPLVSNVAHYATIVSEHAARRALVETGQRIIQLGYTSSDNLPALYDSARTALDQAGNRLPITTNTPTSWTPVNLSDILTGDLTGPTATILTRRDGKHLLYPSAVHSIAGEPGSGKTWAALVATTQELEQDHPVLYVDFEDRPQTIVARLRALGATDTQILTGLRYIRPDTAITPTTRTQLTTAAAGTTLAVIDGITEAMAMHGLAINDNDDVAKWLHMIPNLLADAGPAVLQVDHVTKNSETRGRYAIGAQHKLAGITGVAYKMLTVRSFGQGSKGHAKLVVDKDKHGDVGPNGATVADLHLDATDPTGRLYAWLDSPQASIDGEGHFRPTVLMTRVSTYLLAKPGAATLNDIKKGVKGNNESIAAAVDALIREGHVRVEQGANRALLHHLVEAFEED